MRLLKSFFLCLLCLARAATAQVTGDEPRVSVEFSLFAWQTDLPALRYSPRQKVDGIESFTRSNAQSYSGPATLNFYPVSANLEPAPDGGRPAPLVSVTLPQGATKITLVTVADGPGHYRMHAVPEDGDSLPEQSIRLHNFTGLRLAVAFDEKGVADVPATGSAVIKPGGKATVIRIAREENGVWRKLFNNVVELNTDNRANVILAPGQGRAVNMYSLPPWPRVIPAKTVVSRR